MMDSEQDDILNRFKALLNKDKVENPSVVENEPDIPLLTEIYTPALQQVQQEVQQTPQVVETDTLVEELLPVMLEELEELMRLAIIDLRPKTEALLRQYLEQALAQREDPKK